MCVSITISRNDQSDAQCNSSEMHYNVISYMMRAVRLRGRESGGEEILEGRVRDGRWVGAG